MGFFDFLPRVAAYAEDPGAVARLNERHRRIVVPLVPQIAGARVLDLAAHDGRWSYAFAAAGAAQVVGIEGRQDLIDRFAQFPQSDFAARVTLRCDDIFDGMEQAIAAGERFDVVAVLACVFRSMRPAIPTTCAHLFRGIRPPVTRCREAASFGYQV